MWNSLARSSLVTCLIHDRWLWEKPWMKRISGPLGLPQSCAEMDNPSGVFTETALNFLSCATADVAVAATRKVATEIPARWCRGNARVMGLLRCWRHTGKTGSQNAPAACPIGDDGARIEELPSGCAEF